MISRKENKIIFKYYYTLLLRVLLYVKNIWYFSQEYHKGENLVIDNVEMNNVVYMFRCQDSTLTIKGKMNSVVMDSCRKSSVVFDSLVSSIEFVNCQSVQMQVCVNTIVPFIISVRTYTFMALTKTILDIEITLT